MQSTECVGRGFWQFFGRGLLVTSASIMVYLVSVVIWADFLHHNPNRTLFNSWQMIAWSPIYGIALSLTIALLPVIIAALGAKLMCQMAGRFPIFAIPLLLLPCVLAGLLQGDFIVPPDAGDPPDIKRAIINMVGISLPMLIAFWLWARRLRKRNLRTEYDIAWDQDDLV